MSVLTSHFSDRVFFPQKSRRAQPKGRWLPSRRSRCCFSVWSRAKYARDFRNRTRTFRWATRDCTCVKSGRQHATTVKLQRGDFFKLLLFFFYFLAFCKDFTNHVVHVLKKNTKTINEPYTKCSNYDAFLFLSNVCSLWIWRYQKGLGKRQQRTAKSVC